MNKIIVIGGGPAGLMAAIAAAENGADAVLLERGSKLGTKLRITGKGRCNVTNNCEIEEFIQNVPTNSSFLYSSFYTFTNTDVINMLEKLNVKTKVERGGRVFPVSDNANDVADALVRRARQCGVDIKPNCKAVEIKTDNGAVCGVKTEDGFFACDKVIMACGGASYPKTGSDGFGFKLAKSLGHTVTPLQPSLIPLIAEEAWVKAIAGLSLKNVGIKIYKDGVKKPLYDDFGEMLFTHFGVSGPIILSASSHIRKFSNLVYRLFIDLKPALDNEALDKRIQRDFEKYINKDYINALSDLLPNSLIDVIAELSEIPAHKKVNSITKEERLRLVGLLKALPVTIIGARPINEAIITSGGVSVKEINPSTMESKLISGLYFAGEMIDVDAYTGGFNLQIAFSTGHLAGVSACE